MERGHPIRHVAHYEDDHSWSFLAGTKQEQDDLILVHMEHILAHDDSLRSIANLEPGWTAWRDDIDEPWERYQEEPEEND